LTGPGIGKILLDTKIFIGNKRKLVEIEGEIYLHLKGYSLARITHLDIESPILNKIIPPKKHIYGILQVDDIFKVHLRNKFYIEDLELVVDRIVLKCSELVSILRPVLREWVYVGGKWGGIFIGFKKREILKLEEFGKRHLHIA